MIQRHFTAERRPERMGSCCSSFDSRDCVRIGSMGRQFELKVSQRLACRGALVLAIALTTIFGAAAAQDVPDFTGVWLATSPRGGGGEPMPALTARAQADLDVFDPLTDPVIRCVPPGFPRSGAIIYPLQIVQTDELVLFLYESFGMIRRIYMDGRSMPAYWPPSLMGFSVGRFEGDELVIDTVNYAPGILVSRGVFQYGDMSVVERYRLVDGGRGLEGDVYISAPETFEDTWLRQYTWELDPNGMIFESICDPADSRFIETQ